MKIQIYKESDIGKYFMVKCAKMGNGDGEYYWCPIIGEEHADNQFDFHHKHYHVDGRFIGKSKHLHINSDGHCNTVCAKHIPGKPHLFELIEIKLQRRKLYRTTTGIIPPNPRWHKKSKYWKWVEKMKGKSCAGKKCPHLGTEMMERDGRLVCPLHNLMGKDDVIIGACEIYN